MRQVLACSLILLSNAAATEQLTETISTIAFGSCASQHDPQPIWDDVLRDAPDLFVFLGDNLYGDTANMNQLREEYETFGAVPGIQRLFASVPVLATWDDHDYAFDDAGGDFAHKAISKEIFLDFFREPPDSPRRTRDGIYTSYTYGDDGKRVQIILLDLRSFRSPLKRNPDARRDSYDEPRYLPDDSNSATLLGEAQWTWLKTELLKPADLRIIGTSIQFAAELHGWEAWANMPRERARMIDLISDTGANGVVFISGDMHYGELSVVREDVPYPIYDFTSSGINKVWIHEEDNLHGVTPQVAKHNYGLVEIDWTSPEPTVAFVLKGLGGQEFFRHSVAILSLRGEDREIDSAVE